MRRKRANVLDLYFNLHPVLQSTDGFSGVDFVIDIDGILYGTLKIKNKTCE